jgi:hypothetical protein
MPLAVTTSVAYSFARPDRFVTCPSISTRSIATETSIRYMYISKIQRFRTFPLKYDLSTIKICKAHQKHLNMVYIKLNNCGAIPVFKLLNGIIYSKNSKDKKF